MCVGVQVLVCFSVLVGRKQAPHEDMFTESSTKHRMKNRLTCAIIDSTATSCLGSTSMCDGGAPVHGFERFSAE